MTDCEIIDLDDEASYAEFYEEGEIFRKICLSPLYEKDPFEEWFDDDDDDDDDDEICKTEEDCCEYIAGCVPIAFVNKEKFMKKYREDILKFIQQVLTEGFYATNFSDHAVYDEEMDEFESVEELEEEMENGFQNSRIVNDDPEVYIIDNDIRNWLREFYYSDVIDQGNRVWGFAIGFGVGDDSRVKAKLVVAGLIERVTSWGWDPDSYPDLYIIDVETAEGSNLRSAIEELKNKVSMWGERMEEENLSEE